MDLRRRVEAASEEHAPDPTSQVRERGQGGAEVSPESQEPGVATLLNGTHSRGGESASPIRRILAEPERDPVSQPDPVPTDRPSPAPASDEDAARELQAALIRTAILEEDETAVRIKTKVSSLFDEPFPTLHDVAEHLGLRIVPSRDPDKEGGALFKGPKLVGVYDINEVKIHPQLLHPQPEPTSKPSETAATPEDFPVPEPLDEAFARVLAPLQGIALEETEEVLFIRVRPDIREEGDAPTLALLTSFLRARLEDWEDGHIGSVLFRGGVAIGSFLVENRTVVLQKVALMRAIKKEIDGKVAAAKAEAEDAKNVDVKVRRGDIYGGETGNTVLERMAAELDLELAPCWLLIRGDIFGYEGGQRVKVGHYDNTSPFIRLRRDLAQILEENHESPFAQEAGFI